MVRIARFSGQDEPADDGIPGKTAPLPETVEDDWDLDFDPVLPALSPEETDGEQLPAPASEPATERVLSACSVASGNRRMNARPALRHVAGAASRRDH